MEPKAETTKSETAAKSEVVKAKDVGRVTIIGATETEGLYGPQLRLRTEGGQTIYIPTTSGLAKGIMSGKLTFPLVVSHAWCDTCDYSVWWLSPTRGPTPRA